jgi:hypothetical protein
MYGDVGFGVELVGRAGPGMVGVGAPKPQVALVIETAGTVLLSCEIRMCLTPLSFANCDVHGTRPQV